MAAYDELTDYVIQERIGSGSFAVVHKGYKKTPLLRKTMHRGVEEADQSIFEEESKKQPRVAIKIMDLRRMLSGPNSNKEQEQTAHEEAALRRLAEEIRCQDQCKDSAYTVPLYEVFRTPDSLYLIMELCWGDLPRLMNTSSHSFNRSGAVFRCFSEPQTRHLFRHLALGLQCLFRHSIVHRDLKPQNLLISFPSYLRPFEPGFVPDPMKAVLKISDFGFAKTLSEATLTGTFCGSPLYMAPELFLTTSYTNKADLYSSGAILMEMLTGKPPYPCKTLPEVMQTHHSEKSTPVTLPEELVQQVHPDCVHLLRGLLGKNPSTRISFAEFFNHPWLDLSPSEEPSPPPPSSSSPSSSTPPSSLISVSSDHFVWQAIRNLERVAAPSDRSMFEDPSGLTREKLNTLVDKIASIHSSISLYQAQLQREEELRRELEEISRLMHERELHYQELDLECHREYLVSGASLKPDDRAMFFISKGVYQAYGSFQLPHYLHPDSNQVFAQLIRSKSLIFGVVICTEDVRNPSSPSAIPSLKTPYVLVTLAPTH